MAADSKEWRCDFSSAAFEFEPGIDGLKQHFLSHNRIFRVCDYPG